MTEDYTKEQEPDPRRSIALYPAEHSSPGGELV